MVCDICLTGCPLGPAKSSSLLKRKYVNPLNTLVDRRSKNLLAGWLLIFAFIPAQMVIPFPFGLAVGVGCIAGGVVLLLRRRRLT